MSNGLVIFNPHEKEVLLYSLYNDYPQLREIIEGLITQFEQADYSKKIVVGNNGKKGIDLFLLDKEELFPPLASFYENNFGFPDDSLEKRLLEAGIFYIICKLMLVKYHYSKGMNKLMFASTLPKLPERFTPLYLFRMGSINLEQGVIVEAGNTLELAARCCRRYKLEPMMKKMEELILYQILRVYIIKEDFSEAWNIINAIKEILNEEENIIFSSLVGYYYRNTYNLDKALDILDKAYEKYKKDEEAKNTFSRHWFNTIYQRAFCYREIGDLDQAKVLVKEARATLDDKDYRNHGYCENLMGSIETRQPKSDLDKALGYFQSAYDYFEEYNDYRNMARVKRNIGRTFFGLKKYPNTIQAYNESLAYDYRIRAEISIARTLLYKMDLRIELIQYYKARDYLKRIKKLNISRDHYIWGEIKKRKKRIAKLDIPQDELVGESKVIREVKKEIQHYARTDIPVLILGERGVGKSMIAEIIHEKSGREGEFVKIDCPTISNNLLESELFGHLKGSFTGAIEDKTGILELAHKGTIFLDEIGDLPPVLQAKLLQFVVDKTIRTLGSTKIKKLDIRIICATNKNLQEEIFRNNFRGDLYDRISGLTVEIPPLRNRKEDMRKLAKFFYVQNCKEQRKDVCGIEHDVLNYIEDYSWPGNVRELEYTIKRCVHKLEDGQPITKECFLNAIDRNLMKQKEFSKNNYQGSRDIIGDFDNTVIPKIINRLEKIEDQLKNLGDGSRITDSLNMLNKMFKIIQENGPIRKSDIVKQCSDLGKSFHHWANILRDKHQVIKESKARNFKVYTAALPEVLKQKLENGELEKIDDFYSVVEQ